ncbi:uncharacterized protein (DUF1501 family) [Devosia sp. UYZn731]|uniref:DUF1501 domain-containing protein n=1 Tax=Devosia sp. UYZn731 TaxID=3156345 RepID=UPI00339947A8
MDTNCPQYGLLHPSRRMFLASAGAFVAWASLPRHAYAGTRDPRFITIILRGAMDGLAVVPPIGDPDYATLRGELAIGAPGQEQTLALDGFFGLNNAMPGLHAMYQAGEALIVHAAATPYRDRSHFDGQDVLESGMPGAKLSASGWMNRVAEAIPVGEGVRPVTGLAATPTVPLILRGAAPTLTWTPPELRPASSDTRDRLLDLYTHQDPAMAKVLLAGIETDRLAGGSDPMRTGKGIAAAFEQIATGSARLLVEEDGPRIAALSYDGWDTHSQEGAESGRLAGLLAALDGALGAIKETMAPVWGDTVIAVVTEFGRTAKANGTDGTDHGTATTAFLLGGAVKGGRVVADWPGLKDNQLFEARDLAPTIDLRAVLKGVLRDHLGLSETVLATTVFPDSIGVRPVDGLVV